MTVQPIPDGYPRVTPYLEKAGLATTPPLLGDWTSDSGYEFGRSHDFGQATAVFAANDQMALGLIAGLAQEGTVVPRDVSVVGFDDNPDAAYYRPSLTTVAVDVAGEARRCVGAALGETTSPVAHAPRLVVRSSAARV